LFVYGFSAKPYCHFISWAWEEILEKPVWSPN